MTETVKIKYTIATDKIGSDCHGETEVPTAEWEAMSDDEKEDMMKDLAFNDVDWSFWVAEGDEQ